MNTIDSVRDGDKPQDVFRLLVCGSRYGIKRETLARLMNEAVGDRPKSEVLIIHGAAPGVDTQAGELAHAAGARVLEFPANWRRYGNDAGPIRNQQMLDEGKPDLVLAAPGGKGTANMVRLATAVGVPVLDKRKDRR